jgi:chloramphenicol-sensitive protein RarD
MEQEKDTAIRDGLIAAVLAYTMWGFFPIYFKLIPEVSTTEVLAHRVIWSVPFGALILTFRKQWAEVKAALKNSKTLRALALSSVVIAGNWGLYIWAVQQSRIFEASLGYYINPLIFVLVGVLLVGERLHKLQMVAVVLATTGVGILTIYGGVFPWISITLAISFTAYGYIRKQVDVGAMPGLFIETLVLLPVALLYWSVLLNNGTSGFNEGDVGLSGLILLAGPLTVLPLVCFAFATRRLQLSTVGFLQYIGPTLQFCVGLYYGEQFTTAHAFCFGFIWLAVLVFSYDALRRGRKPVSGTA